MPPGILLAELLDLSIVLLDRERHPGDLVEYRVQRLREPWRHHGQAALRETARRCSRHTVPACLGETAHGVHCRGAEPNQHVAGADQGEGLLLFDGSVCDRTQDLRIQPRVPCQLLGIDFVALPIAMRDGSQLAHVRDDHFMTEFLELLTDPDRVRSGLHRKRAPAARR